MTGCCVHLKDKVEPVWSLGAHPRGEMAGDPRGRRVLRILQQEVWADRGLAYHRHKLVGKPNLKWGIKTFEKRRQNYCHIPCFLVRGQTGWKHLRRIPVTGMSFIWRICKMWIVLPGHEWLQLLLHIQFSGVEHQLQSGFPGNALQK